MKRVVVASAVGALLLTACSSDDSAGDAAATVETTARPAAVVSVEVNPGTSEGFEGARDDVESFDCERGDDGWTVSGDVTNTTDDSVSYRIYTSFLDDARVTIGLLQVNADEVAPGESREWSGSIAVAAERVDCILRVERTPIGS